MSGKTKRNKSKKKAGSKTVSKTPNKGPNVIANMELVWRAITNDNPQELQSLLEDRNPFRLTFQLSYGDRFGIQTICGLMGAWDCLVWLQEKVRAQSDLDDLDADFANRFREDMDTATELLGTAVRNGDQKAENALCELLYWVIKLSSAAELVFQKEFLYKDSPHYANAEARVLAEQEQDLLSNPEITRLPQESNRPRKPRGIDG